MSKDNNVKEKIYPNEFDKTTFEVLIKDFEKSIERLSGRNEQLPEIIIEMQNKINLYNSETRNTIAELTMKINLEIEKLNNQKSSVNAVERQRLEDRDKHNHEMNLLQEKYQDSRKTLLSKIKVLTGRVYALENYKKCREDLSNKLDENERKMMKNEEQLKDRLLQIERKLKTDEQKIFQDLRENIFEEFKLHEIESLKQIPQAVERLFRENTNIINSLEEISADYNKIK